MSRALPRLLLLATLFVLALAALPAGSREPLRADASHHIQASALPAEAIDTLARIQRGGPFPYSRDGITFQNREGRLPPRTRGYYREYTVPTPGARDRGARRIITGGDPPREYYYTPDHYRSFRPIEVRP